MVEGPIQNIIQNGYEGRKLKFQPDTFSFFSFSFFLILLVVIESIDLQTQFGASVEWQYDIFFWIESRLYIQNGYEKFK